MQQSLLTKQSVSSICFACFKSLCAAKKINFSVVHWKEVTYIQQQQTVYYMSIIPISR